MSRLKKIALMHFSAAPVVGGVEHVMQQHARLMARAGHTVKILAGIGEQIDADIEFIKLEHAYSKHPDILLIKAALDQGEVSNAFEEVTDKLFQEISTGLRGAEIIIAHNICSLIKNLPLTAALKRYVQNEKQVKLICWQHDLAFAAERYQNELHRGYPWDLVSTPWSDCDQHFVAVSEKAREEVSQIFQIPREDIHVISSGVEERNFLEISEETSSLLYNCHITPSNTVLLLPVRITRRKNIELALRICSELAKLQTSCALLVTGPPGAHNATNDDYFQMLLELRKELGIEPQPDGSGVHFLYEQHSEALSDRVISDLFRASDALLMTSTDEGLGIPLIEAGYAKLPAFCSDIPTFHEIAGELPTFFSLSEDPAQISIRIHDTLRQDTAYQLKHRVRSKYSWEEIFHSQIQPLLEN